MSQVAYVSEDAKQRTHEFEERFIKLPAQAGVIFASVRAIPAIRGEVDTYEVRLGMKRGLEEGTGIALIKHVLRDEIEKGLYSIRGSIYIGRAGAARDQGDEEAHPVKA